jgi:diguanylate cyclase
MTILIDIAFLLVAAGAGAVVAGLGPWLRTRLWPAKDADATDHFARDTLSRLQDLTRRVAAEVDQHAEAVEEINAVLASDENDEAAVVAAVSQLITANERMKRQLDSAEERLASQATQIETHAAAARTDPLTQVANRRAIDDELARCAADFQRRGTPTTVMLVDVDHFKQFNDSHGHQAGDLALIAVARTLQAIVGDLGLVARWGGEEFAVIFAGRTAAEATTLGERARKAIGGLPIRTAGRELRVTASAGVAEMLVGEAEGQAMGRADIALYASKRAGRNCAHLHDGQRCRLLRLHDAPESKPQPTVAREQGTGDRGQEERPAFPESPKLGHEWLFDAEAEVATEVLFREPLTNVESRPAFFDGLIRRLGELRRGGPPLTVLLVQVDAYGRIVADHGPTKAAVVLRIAAQLINASMRDMDTVARLGDDTFVLLLPGAVLADGVTIAERLRQAVERCRLPRKAGVNWFTISAGVVQAAQDEDLRHVLDRGRAALSGAVNQGRNCVVGRRSISSASQEMAAAVVAQ